MQELSILIGVLIQKPSPNRKLKVLVNDAYGELIGNVLQYAYKIVKYICIEYICSISCIVIYTVQYP